MIGDLWETMIEIGRIDHSVQLIFALDEGKLSIQGLDSTVFAFSFYGGSFCWTALSLPHEVIEHSRVLK